MWRPEEIESLSKRFGIRAGVRLHRDAEDFHFPEGSFLSRGYAPSGGYVKDFGLVMREGRLHLFHIDGRPGEVCWVTGNEISFGHASTSDFRRWIRHPMPLAVGERPWESEHVWAPFVFERQGVYYLFYMGGGRGEAVITYATSPDLESWTRWPDGPIRCTAGRDPFVFERAGQVILLYTGDGGARVAACASDDMIDWEQLPDLLRIPGGVAAESCSLHPLGGRHVLWFNDYGPELAGFRAAYAVSDDPFHFDPAAIREFRFVTDHPEATPSAELPVARPVPLSIERIAGSGELWFVAYFRWHKDRNRLFFGSLDWSADPATIREINSDRELNDLLRRTQS
ncbi:MAG: hypothetical protein PHR35_11300 [Kiritimatiellae bacterium]|nr:hypothetical protein [Kiritimatiellia bacterium]